nr:retrotransposon protein putative Ty1-copia subclass [Tanacetum cinerariifolium]
MAFKKYLSDAQHLTTYKEMRRMGKILYASAIGSIMYVMTCTRPDVTYVLSMTSRFQYDLGEEHWTAVKTIQWAKLSGVRLLSTSLYVLAIIVSLALTSGPSEVLSVRESHDLHEYNSLKEIDQIVAQRVTDAIKAIVVYEAIRMAHDSMNQVVRQGTTVEKNANNKRKFENQPKDNRVP